MMGLWLTSEETTKLPFRGVASFCISSSLDESSGSSPSSPALARVSLVMLASQRRETGLRCGSHFSKD